MSLDISVSFDVLQIKAWKNTSDNYQISALLNPSGYIKKQDCALEMDNSA
jgi:hypothetical protein